jgi:hypothetical protein
VPDVRFSDHRPLLCDFEVTSRTRIQPDRKAG